MSYKKINPLNFTTLLGLSLIVLCSCAFNSSKEVKTIPESNQAVGKDPKINLNNNNPVQRDSIVSYAMGFLGTPYAGGGCSKDGFDCSGFVFYVFQHFKIHVPRSSSEFQNFGKEIAIEEVKKGDILVFLSPTRNVIGHVGIVVNPKGMESDFIHSSSGREMKVIITSLKKEGYTRRFVKAVSVL